MTQLAATPPMGWNSWNAFRTRIDEDQLVEMAEVMVTSGMRDAGYRYLVVDDGWQAQERDAAGRLQAHPERFSRGIAALAAEIHDRGLLFGLYGSPGLQTCANIWDGYPGRELGSFGREQLDADTFADWGVDYLKYDWCDAQRGTNLSRIEAFAAMRAALEATGRPMVYSISEYGYTNPWEWAPGIAHQWRTTDDIEPTWHSVAAIATSQRGLERFAGPGGWNDPDMLQIGNGDLTDAENRSHLVLWAMLAAPLMAGNDLRVMTEPVRKLLTDPALIALAQDPLGRQGRRVQREYVCDLWRRELSDHRVAYAVVNTCPVPLQLTLAAADTGATVIVEGPGAGAGISDEFSLGRYLLPIETTDPVQLGTAAPIGEVTLASHDSLVLVGSLA